MKPNLGLQVTGPIDNALTLTHNLHMVNVAAQRKIIHVDMDCFYAAVEVKHRPELRGKPIGIGGPPNTRSVLCTASYEARKFGVKAAMPSSMAVRLCPDLILVPPNFDLYQEESRKVRSIFHRFTDLVEPLSLDEAYLDVTAASAFGGSASLLALEIRKRIASECGLTASAGIAANKFLAKIASDWKKPNGQFAIPPHQVAPFMISLPVEKIFGVGKVTAKKMHSLGLKTCGDIQKKSIFELRSWFGSRAQELSDLAHGIDLRKVEPHSERKSVSVEATYDQDLMTLKEALAKLPELYADWESRMSSEYRDRQRGISVKLKFADFQQATHEISTKAWPQIAEFSSLLETLWNRHQKPVRLIGLGAKLSAGAKAEDADQLSFAV